MPTRKKKATNVKPFMDYIRHDRGAEFLNVERITFYSHITDNSDNSCFVDANFELLWNSVLPFIRREENCNRPNYMILLWLSHFPTI
jgi:hypothetical protein